MKLVHITIHTAAIRESVDFYREVLAFSVDASFTNTAGTPIVFLKSPAGEVRIELIDDPARAYSGSGLSLGFRTADLAAAWDAMEQRGLHPTAMVSPSPNVRFFFITDPNGVRIQIL
ncbi:MAG: VOC family protein [Eubacteriales bacterium]|nr:VOC family protein [Eubacteriales bacterium]